MNSLERQKHGRIKLVGKVIHHSKGHLLLETKDEDGPLFVKLRISLRTGQWPPGGPSVGEEVKVEGMLRHSVLLASSIEIPKKGPEGRPTPGDFPTDLLINESLVGEVVASNPYRLSIRLRPPSDPEIVDVRIRPNTYGALPFNRPEVGETAPSEVTPPMFEPDELMIDPNTNEPLPLRRPEIVRLEESPLMLEVQEDLRIGHNMTGPLPLRRPEVGEIVRFEARPLIYELDALSVKTTGSSSKAEYTEIVDRPEKNGAGSLTGIVVLISPKNITLRVDANGGTELARAQMNLRTKFHPFRRPKVKERVHLKYVRDGGARVARQVTVIKNEAIEKQTRRTIKGELLP
jgi:hypothetical protein